MTLAELFKQQQDLLDKTRTSLAARALTADSLKLAPQATQRRVEAVTAAIDNLTKQKETAIARYDAAIAERQAELKSLQDVTTRNNALSASLQRRDDEFGKAGQIFTERVAQSKT